MLVLNAGLVMRKRTETVDGFETTFGVNHLGHFELAKLLLDRLRASAPSRIVVVSSHAHKMVRKGLDFDDLQTVHRHYRAFDAYSRSKLANVYFTRELARRLAGTGVTVNAAHPGYVASRFARDGDLYLEPVISLGAKLFAISPEQGAQTSVYLASSPDVEGVTGHYFAKCRRDAGVEDRAGRHRGASALGRERRAARRGRRLTSASEGEPRRAELVHRDAVDRAHVLVAASRRSASAPGTSRSARTASRGTPRASCRGRREAASPAGLPSAARTRRAWGRSSTCHRSAGSPSPRSGIHC